MFCKQAIEWFDCNPIILLSYRVQIFRFVLFTCFIYLFCRPIFSPNCFFISFQLCVVLSYWSVLLCHSLFHSKKKSWASWCANFFMQRDSWRLKLTTLKLWLCVLESIQWVRNFGNFFFSFELSYWKCEAFILYFPYCKYCFMAESRVRYANCKWIPLYPSLRICSRISSLYSLCSSMRIKMGALNFDFINVSRLAIYLKIKNNKTCFQLCPSFFFV